MTLMERRTRELERLQQLKDAAQAVARDMERAVGRIHLLDELLKESADAPDGNPADAAE